MFRHIRRLADRFKELRRIDLSGTDIFDDFLTILDTAVERSQHDNSFPLEEKEGVQAQIYLL